jgi:hypothetical protein
MTQYKKFVKDAGYAIKWSMNLSAKHYDNYIIPWQQTKKWKTSFKTQNLKRIIQIILHITWGSSKVLSPKPSSQLCLSQSSG